MEIRHVRKSYCSSGPAHKQCRRPSSHTGFGQPSSESSQFEVDHRPGKNLEIVAYLADPQHSKAINDGLTAVGTVHFARFLPESGFLLGKSQTLWVLTEYDGTFDQYIEDFVNQMGDIFDDLLSFVADPPPLPVKNNIPAFEAWVNAHNEKSNLYSAYPTLTVQAILNS